MKRDGSSLSSTLNRRRRKGRIHEEPEQVGHCTSFQNSAMISYHPPPKKAKKGGMELGIFPDIPGARLKAELDEGISHNISKRINEDSIYITPEADGSELESMTTSTTPQVALPPDNSSEIKVEDSESEGGLLGIKLEVSPTKVKGSSHVDLFEGPDDDVNFDANGLVTTDASAGLHVAAEFDDNLHETTKVMLEEYESPLDETEPIIKMEVFPDSHHVQAKVEICESENDDSNDSELQGEEAVGTETETVVVSDQEGSIQKPNIFSKKSPKSSKCTYCGFVCSAAGIHGRKGSILKHQVRFHPEHFLLDKNEIGLRPTRENYLQILTDVVYPKYVKITGRTTSCSLCGRSYQSRNLTDNVTSVRQHLLYRHKSELRKDLKIALEDPLLDPLSLPRRQIHGQSSTERALRTCPYCSFKSTSNSSSGSMIDHLVRFHPQHYLIDENDKAAGLGHDHDKFRTILTNMVYPSFILKTQHHRSCSLCGTSYKSSILTQNMLSVKKHLIFCHKRELKNNLKAVLDDPNLRKKLKKSSTKSTANASADNEKFSSKCPYCSFTCTSHSPFQSNLESGWGSLMAHVVRFHPEHYLIDEEDKAEGLWHSQFGIILEDMIYPNLISNSNSRPGHRNRRSCSLCGVSYKCGQVGKNDVMMRRHLLFNHKLELKEKFKLLLEDPLLEEKLKSCKRVKKTRTRTSNSKGTVEKLSFKKCPHCQYECGAKDSNVNWNRMVQHLVRLHPEHFFLDQDEDANEEIQKFLMDVVFPKFARETGKHSSCSLCGMKYESNSLKQNVLSLRRHFIFQHKVEVKEELGRTQTQEEPFPRERLKTDMDSKILN